MEIEINKVSPFEILQGKFKNTIALIEGYLAESKGDMSVGTSYGARAVHNRFEDVQKAFETDLRKLSSECRIKS